MANSVTARLTHPLPGALVIALISSIVVSASSAGENSDVAGKLVVRPAEIHLSGFNPRQQILVSLNESNDRSVDVTRDSKVELANHKVALEINGIVSATGTGVTELTVTRGEFQARVVVHVTAFGDTPEVHFENDILPLLSKSGCNSGGCHGKASGQNGFKLSVFGFDSRADFAALAKEARGRRVFPGDPERSLLVQKATGVSAHGGGRRIELNSPDHELLANWIRQGMPWGAANAPQPVGIEVEPGSRVVDRSARQQLLVTAVYSDGSRRDVTAASTYSSNSPVVADLVSPGLVETGEVPGESAVTVNYMGQVAAARVVVPRADLIEEYPALPEHNPIDGFVWSKLQRMRILPSGPCDDSAFLRRLYLDVLGQLPDPEVTRQFLADSDPDKRTRQIDDVLSNAGYADYHALKWADVLMVDRETLGERGAFEFHRWLREQMANNRTYDEWVRELITASGNSGKFGPVNFYRALRTPDDLTRAVSQAFLGIRMDCAQCHHHPFEKWGQSDFYGLAGFFGGVQRKSLSDSRELVFHTGWKQTKMPLTNELVTTRPPGGEPIDTSAADPRVQLADWMTSPTNPWFARLVANRLWAQYLGRGLVDPVDDLRSTNPAVNEPLLEWLTQQVISNDFNLKAVARLILCSRVYQLASTSNETNKRDEQNFSHFLARRLPAEVLLDAICHVTDVPEDFPGMPIGTRAIQVWDNRFPSYFLDTFGRSERKSPCECGKSDDPTMSQALHLMNAPEIAAKVSSGDGRIGRLIRADAAPESIAEEICLAAWCRYPREKELDVFRRLVAESSSQQAAEDFLWAVLNSYDFLFVR